MAKKNNFFDDLDIVFEELKLAEEADPEFSDREQFLKQKMKDLGHPDDGFLDEEVYFGLQEYDKKKTASPAIQVGIKNEDLADIQDQLFTQEKTPEPLNQEEFEKEEALKYERFPSYLVDRLSQQDVLESLNDLVKAQTETNIEEIQVRGDLPEDENELLALYEELRQKNYVTTVGAILGARGRSLRNQEGRVSYEQISSAYQQAGAGELLSGLEVLAKAEQARPGAFSAKISQLLNARSPSLADPEGVSLVEEARMEELALARLTPEERQSLTPKKKKELVEEFSKQFPGPQAQKRAIEKRTAEIIAEHKGGVPITRKAAEAQARFERLSKEDQDKASLFEKLDKLTDVTSMAWMQESQEQLPIKDAIKMRVKDKERQKAALLELENMEDMREAIEASGKELIDEINYMNRSGAYRSAEDLKQAVKQDSEMNAAIQSLQQMIQSHNKSQAVIDAALTSSDEGMFSFGFDTLTGFPRAIAGALAEETAPLFEKNFADPQVIGGLELKTVFPDTSDTVKTPMGRDPGGASALRALLSERSFTDKIDDTLKVIMEPHQKIGALAPGKSLLPTKESFENVSPEQYDYGVKTLISIEKDLKSEISGLRSQLQSAATDQKSGFEDKIGELERKKKLVTTLKEALLYQPTRSERLGDDPTLYEMIFGKEGDQRHSFLGYQPKGLEAVRRQGESLANWILYTSGSDLPVSLRGPESNQVFMDLNPTHAEAEWLYDTAKIKFRDINNAASIMSRSVQAFDGLIDTINDDSVTSVKQIIDYNTPLGKMRYRDVPLFLRSYAAPPLDLSNEEMMEMTVYELDRKAREQNDGAHLFDLEDLKRAADFRDSVKNQDDLVMGALEDLMTIGSYVEYNDSGDNIIVKQNFLGDVMTHYLPLAEEIVSEAGFSLAEYSMAAYWAGENYQGIRQFPENSGMIDNYINRLIANAEIGMGGFTEMSQDAAVAFGMEEGSTQYHAMTGLGLISSFVVPSEKIVYGAPPAMLKTGTRASQTAKLGRRALDPQASLRETIKSDIQFSLLGAINFQAEAGSLASKVPLSPRVALADYISENLNKKVAASGQRADQQAPVPFREVPESQLRPRVNELLREKYLDTRTGERVNMYTRQEAENIARQELAPDAPLREGAAISPENLLGSMAYAIDQHLIEMGRNPITEAKRRAKEQSISNDMILGIKFFSNDLTRLDLMESHFNKLGLTLDEMEALIDLEILREMPERVRYSEEYIRKGPEEMQDIRRSAEWQEFMDILRKAKDAGLITDKHLPAYESVFISIALSTGKGFDGASQILKNLTLRIKDNISESEPTIKQSLQKRVESEFRSFRDKEGTPLNADYELLGADVIKNLEPYYQNKADRRTMRRSGLAPYIRDDGKYKAFQIQREAKKRFGAQVYTYPTDPGSVLDPKNKTELVEKIGLRDRPQGKRKEEEPLFLDVRIPEKDKVFTARVQYRILNNEFHMEFMEGDWVSQYLTMAPEKIVRDDLSWRTIATEQSIAWAMQRGLNGAVISDTAIFGQRVFPDEIKNAAPKGKKSPNISDPEKLLLSRINKYMKQWDKLDMSEQQRVRVKKTKVKTEIQFNAIAKADGQAFRDSKFTVGMAKAISADPAFPVKGKLDFSVIRQQKVETLAETLNSFRDLAVRRFVAEEELKRLPRKGSLLSFKDIIDELMKDIDKHVATGSKDKIDAKPYRSKLSKQIRSEKLYEEKRTEKYHKLSNDLLELDQALGSAKDIKSQRQAVQKANDARIALVKEQELFMKDKTYVQRYMPLYIEKIQEQSPGSLFENFKVSENYEEIKAQARKSAKESVRLRDEDKMIQNLKRLDDQLVISQSTGFDNINKSMDLANREQALAAERIKVMKARHQMETQDTMNMAEGAFSEESVDFVADSATSSASDTTVMTEPYRDANDPTRVVYPVGDGAEIHTRTLVDDNGRFIRVVDNAQIDMFHDVSRRPEYDAFLREIDEQFKKEQPDVSEQRFRRQHLNSMLDEERRKLFTDMASPGREAVRRFIGRLQAEDITSVGWSEYNSHIGEAILEEFAVQGVDLRGSIGIVKHNEFVGAGLEKTKQTQLYYFVDMPGVSKQVTMPTTGGDSLRLDFSDLRGADGVEYTSVADQAKQLGFHEQDVETVESLDAFIKKLPAEKRDEAMAIAKWTGLQRMISSADPDVTNIHGFLEQYNVHWGQALDSRMYGFTYPGLVRLQKSLQESKAELQQITEMPYTSVDHNILNNSIAHVDEALSSVGFTLESFEQRAKRKPTKQWFEEENQDVLSRAPGEYHLLDMTIPVNLKSPVGYFDIGVGPADKKYSAGPNHGNALFRQPNVRVRAKLKPLEINGERYMMVESLGSATPYMTDGSKINGAGWAEIAVRHLTHLAAREGFDHIAISTKASIEAQAITNMRILPELDLIAADWEMRPESALSSIEPHKRGIGLDAQPGATLQDGALFKSLRISDEMKDSVVDRATPLFSKVARKKASLRNKLAELQMLRYGTQEAYRRMSNKKRDAFVQVEMSRLNEEIEPAVFPDLEGYRIIRGRDKRYRIGRNNKSGSVLKLKDLEIEQTPQLLQLIQEGKNGFRNRNSAYNALVEHLYQTKAKGDRRDTGATQIGRLFKGFDETRVVSSLRYEPTVHLALFDKEFLIGRSTEQPTVGGELRLSAAPWYNDFSDLLYRAEDPRVMINSPGGEAFGSFPTLFSKLSTTGTRKASIIMPNKIVEFELPQLRDDIVKAISEPDKTNRRFSHKITRALTSDYRIINEMMEDLSSAIMSERNQAPSKGVTFATYLDDLQNRTQTAIEAVFADKEYKTLFKPETTFTVTERPHARPNSTRSISGSLFHDFAGPGPGPRQSMAKGALPRLSKTREHAPQLWFEGESSSSGWKYIVNKGSDEELGLRLLEPLFTEQGKRKMRIPELSDRSNEHLSRLAAEHFVNTRMASAEDMALFLGIDGPKMMEDVPAYIRQLADHLQNVHNEFMTRKYKPSDVAKAFFITVGSIQASEISYSQFTDYMTKGPIGKNASERRSKLKWTGDEWSTISIKQIAQATGQEYTFLSQQRDRFGRIISPDSKVFVEYIRPESAIAAWLISPKGIKAMQELDRGNFDLALNDIKKIRSAFGGEEKVLGAKSIFREDTFVETVTELAKKFNEAKAHPTNPIDAMQKVALSIKGIGQGKYPFLMQFLGFGHRATMDAQELNAWFVEAIRYSLDETSQKSEKKLAEMIRRKLDKSPLKDLKLPDGRTFYEAIADRIRNEISEMKKLNLPAINSLVNNPFFEGIMHQWIWTHMKQFESAQPELFNSMLTTKYQKVDGPMISFLSNQAKLNETGAVMAANYLKSLPPELWAHQSYIDSIVNHLNEYHELGAEIDALKSIALKYNESLRWPERDTGLDAFLPLTPEQISEDVFRLNDAGLYQTGEAGVIEGRYRNPTGMPEIDLAKMKEGPLAFAHEMAHLLQDIVPPELYNKMTRDYDSRQVGGRRVLTRAGREQMAEDFAHLVEQGFMNQLPSGRRASTETLSKISKRYLQAYKSSPYWIRKIAGTEKWDPGKMDPLNARWMKYFQIADEAWIQSSLKDHGVRARNPTAQIGDPQYRTPSAARAKYAAEREETGDVYGQAARRLSSLAGRMPVDELLQDLSGIKFGSHYDLGPLKVGSEVNARELYTRMSGYLVTQSAREMASFKTAESVVMTHRTVVPAPVAESIESSVKARLSLVGLDFESIRKNVRLVDIPYELRLKFRGLTEDQIRERLSSQPDILRRYTKQNQSELVLSLKQKADMVDLVEQIRREPLGQHLTHPDDMFFSSSRNGEDVFVISLAQYNEIHDAMVDVTVPIGSRRSRVAESMSTNIVSNFFSTLFKNTVDKLSKDSINTAIKESVNKLKRQFVVTQPGKQTLNPKVTEVIMQARRKMNALEDIVQGVIRDMETKDRNRLATLVNPRPVPLQQVIRNLRRMLLPPVETINIQRLRDIHRKVTGSRQQDLIQTRNLNMKLSDYGTTEAIVSANRAKLKSYRLAAEHLENASSETLKEYHGLIDSLEKMNTKDGKTVADELEIRSNFEKIHEILRTHNPPPLEIKDLFADNNMMLKDIKNILYDGQGMDRDTFMAFRVLDDISATYDPSVALSDESRAILHRNVSIIYSAVEKRMRQVEMQADVILGSLLQNFNSSDFDGTTAERLPSVLQRKRFEAYTLFFEGKWLSDDIDMEVFHAKSRPDQQYKPMNPPNGVAWRQADIISIAYNNGLIQANSNTVAAIMAIDEMLATASRKDMLPEELAGIDSMSKIKEGQPDTAVKLAALANFIRQGPLSLRRNRNLFEIAGAQVGAPGLLDLNEIKTNVINQGLEMILRLMALESLHDLSAQLTQLHLYGDIRKTSLDDIIRVGLNPMDNAEQFEFLVTEYVNLWLRNEPVNVERGTLEHAAFLRAQEIVDSYELSQTGQGFDDFDMYTFPDGSQGLMPKTIIDYITQEAFDRVVPVGSETGSLRPRDLEYIASYRRRGEDLRKKTDRFIYERMDLVNKVGKSTGLDADTIYSAMMEEQYLPHMRKAVETEQSEMAQFGGRAGVMGLGALAGGLMAGPLGAAGGGLAGYYLAKKFIDPAFNKNQTDLIKNEWIRMEDDLYAKWRIEKVVEDPDLERTGAFKDMLRQQMKALQLIPQQAARQVFKDIGLDIYTPLIRTVKMGVTAGMYIPTFAYYLGNILGGMVQMQMRLGTKRAFRATPVVNKFSRLLSDKNPEMSMAVTTRLFGSGFRSFNQKKTIVTRGGKIYTADMIADMMIEYGVGSGFVKAEMSRSLADDLYRHNQTAFWKTVHELGGKTVNNLLIETAEATDNFYRVNLFVDFLVEGRSPDDAAKMVRETMFDYADLTDFERDILRQIFIFYAFMRKNTALVWWTMINEPSRLAAQFRLIRNLQRQAGQDEPEITVSDFIRYRPMMPFLRRFDRNTAMGQAYQGKAYVLPPVNGTDGIILMSQMLNAIMFAPQGDEKFREALTSLTSSSNPVIGGVFVGITGKQLFGDMDVQKMEIPNEIVELDAIMGLGIFGYVSKEDPGLMGGVINIIADQQTSPGKQYNPADPWDPRDIKWRPQTPEDGIQWWSVNQFAQGLPLPTSPFLGRSAKQTHDLARLYKYMASDEPFELKEGETYEDVAARLFGMKPVDIMTPETGRQMYLKDVNRKINDRLKQAKTKRPKAE